MVRHRLKADDISWIVPHQANERILRAVGKRVGIPYERFVVTIGKYGNTSAASVSMALGWAAEEVVSIQAFRIGKRTRRSAAWPLNGFKLIRIARERHPSKPMSVWSIG